MPNTVSGIKGRQQAKATLRLLRSAHGHTNASLARAMDRRTNWVQDKLNGPGGLSVDDLAEFADYFDVPVWLLLQEPADVLHWFAEHRPAALMHSERNWRAA